MTRKEIELLVDLLYQASRDQVFSINDRFILRHALETAFHEWRRIHPKRKKRNEQKPTQESS